MARYVVRIELFGNASRQIYDSLHDAMGRKGFSRTIAGDDGTIYELPTATYYVESNLSPADVLAAAQAAADSVWNDAAALVSRTDMSTWRGLRQVPKKRFA